MPDIAIKVTSVMKWFGEGEARTTALREVSLDAYFGEMLYIVGPSGSGKTTLLSVLSGILRPDSGSVSVEGADIWSLSSDKLADFRLHKIGFVFQDFHLFPRLTTAENVAIPLILKRRNWGEAIVEATKYLEIVGLKGRADLPPCDDRRIRGAGSTDDRHASGDRRGRHRADLFARHRGGRRRRPASHSRRTAIKRGADRRRLSQ